jgi:hypothetical protein
MTSTVSPTLDYIAPTYEPVSLRKKKLQSVVENGFCRCLVLLIFLGRKRLTTMYYTVAHGLVLVAYSCFVLFCFVLFW